MRHSVLLSSGLDTTEPTEAIESSGLTLNQLI